MSTGIEEKFIACLLGLALGDALGVSFEGSSSGRSIGGLLARTSELLCWSDDTEMCMGLAKSLIENRGLNVDHLVHHWADNAEFKRGYGRGTRKFLELIRRGQDWRIANRKVYSDGSFGNGASMRVAPIGLFYRDSETELIEAARLASLTTHAHPLGIEGGILIAKATAMALDGSIDLESLRSSCQNHEFRDQLELAKRPLDTSTIRKELGTGVEAHRSVVTSIYLATRFGNFISMIDFVVSLGGDTDTIAAMAGGLFGAMHGISALPRLTLDRLEERKWIERTARGLYNASIS